MAERVSREKEESFMKGERLKGMLGFVFVCGLGEAMREQRIMTTKRERDFAQRISFFGAKRV